MVDVYVYALINPFNKKPFYIGCSIAPHRRLKEHLYDSALPTPKDPVIKMAKKYSRRVRIEILIKTNILDASFWERYYYTFYKNQGVRLYQAPKFSYTNKYKK